MQWTGLDFIGQMTAQLVVTECAVLVIHKHGYYACLYIFLCGHELLSHGRNYIITHIWYGVITPSFQSSACDHW